MHSSSHNPGGNMLPRADAEGDLQVGPRERMESLFDDVADLSRSISDGVDAMLEDLGLSHARWQVLKWVAGGEDKTILAIAQVLGHSRQAVQRIANELNGLGLIRIARGPRRTVSASLEITRHGAEAYFEADARILAWCDHIQLQFSGTEGQLGRRFVARLAAVAKAMDETLVLQCRQNAEAIRVESDTVGVGLIR